MCIRDRSIIASSTCVKPLLHKTSKFSIVFSTLFPKMCIRDRTGAVEFNLFPVSIYSVIGKTRVNETGEESFGMLYYAEIIRFDDIPASEIEKVVLFSQIPNQLTYPLIQPKLIEKVINSNFLKLKFKK